MSSSKAKVVTEPTTTTSSQPSTTTRKKTGSIFSNSNRVASGSATTTTSTTSVSQQITNTSQSDSSTNPITPILNLAQTKQSQTKDETTNSSQTNSTSSTTPRQLPVSPLSHTRSRSSSKPQTTAPVSTTSQSAPPSTVTSPTEPLADPNTPSTSQKMNKIYSNPFFLMDRNLSAANSKPTSISNSPKRNSIDTSKPTTPNSKRNSMEPTISAFSNASQATSEVLLAMKKKRKSLATINGSPTPGQDSPIKSHGGELNLQTLQDAIQKELMLQEQLLQNATMNSPVPQVSSIQHQKTNSNGGTSSSSASVMIIPEFEIPLVECEIPALGNYNSHLRYQSASFFSCMHVNLQQQQPNNSSVQLLQIEPTDELFLTNMPLQLRPFWVMKMLRTTFTFGNGGFIMSEEIFCPQEIWMQDDLRLDGVYGKTKFCQRICDELHALHVKIRDLDLQKDVKFITNEWKEFLKKAKQHYKKLKKHLPLKSKKYSLDEEAQVFANSPIPSATTNLSLEPNSTGGAINIEDLSTNSSSASSNPTSSSQNDGNRIQSPKPKPMERNRSTSKFIDFGKQIFKSAKRTVRSGLGLTEKASDKHPYIPTLLNVFEKSQLFVPWFEFYYCLQNTQQDKELQSGIEAIVKFFQRILTKFILHDWNQMVDRYMKKTRESFSRLFPENAKM